MSAIEDHISKLGMTGQDRVSGVVGVITSVDFDLYGCIQYLITPKAKETGESVDSRWCDVTRIVVEDETRVMPMPDFDAGYIAEGKKGANTDKPAP